MKILTTSQTIAKTLQHLIVSHQRYRWAVAWASVGFALYDELLERQDRITQLVVGTHFYQTHPDFLDALVGHDGVRIVLQPSGVFHPKVYLFERGPSEWACVLGSNNFTGAALSTNVEAAVYFDHESANAREQYKQLRGWLDQQWDVGTPLESDSVERYRSLWKRQARRLNKLSGTYGESTKGKPPPVVELFSLSWEQFAKRVEEEDHHGLGQRLKVLAEARKRFRNYGSFSKMSDEKRRDIAGYAPEDVLPWGYFGSMRGAGKFKHAVKTNNKHLSDALDSVPMDGLVTSDHYFEYVEHFRKAFPKGGDGIAVTTRLLCMKRPDMFVCFDRKNRAALCKEFGIKPSGMTYHRYWEEIIERIRDATWWNASRPKDACKEAVWRGRTALLDALFYDPAA